VEVLSGSVTWPIVGLWTAEVELDTADPPAAGEIVTIEIVGADGTAVGFRGTNRTELPEYHARSRLFVVAGAGGLGLTVAAQHYANSPTALQLVGDILEAAGESLSATVDQAALAALTVPSWMRAEMTGAEGLQLIADAFGYDWRSLADGSIWIGSASWTENTTASLYDLTADPSAAHVEFADAETLAPGDTVKGRKVYGVEHRVSPDDVRTIATFDRSERDDWRKAVRGAIPDLIYHARWPARVVAQNGDGTVDVVADDSRIGGLQRVPVRPGLPGCSTVLAGGARVRVAFEEADPSLAYVSEWDRSTPCVDLSLTTSGTLDLTSGAVSVNSGTAKVARIGDVAKALTLLWDATTTTLYIAAGSPAVPVYSIAVVVASVTGVLPNPNSPAAPVAGTPGTDVYAIITTGALRFFA
jgi:hypothetical protein